MSTTTASHNAQIHPADTAPARTDPAQAVPVQADPAHEPAVRAWPRRSVIAGSGAVLLACAACGSNSAATRTTPAAATSSPAAAAGGSAGGGAAIASVTDIPANAGFIANTPNGKVILAKADGKVVAHTAVCTHQGAIIDGSGTCPLHGSMFNPATGAVVAGPASEPLAAVAVTVTDGKVYTA